MQWNSFFEKLPLSSSSILSVSRIRARCLIDFETMANWHREQYRWWESSLPFPWRKAVGGRTVSEMRGKEGDVKNIKFLRVNWFLESHNNWVSDLRKLEQGEWMLSNIPTAVSGWRNNTLYLHQNNRLKLFLLYQGFTFIFGTGTTLDLIF